MTSVAVSPCGNFGIVGTSAGRVDRYNMQSGLHRGTYCRTASTAGGALGGARLLPAHEGSVAGVAVDSCNRLMVSAGVDRQLRIWDFKV